MSALPQAALFCPGRGSYARGELGFLGRQLAADLAGLDEVRSALEIADERRHAAGRPTVTELDRAGKFRPGLHLDGQNAAELIYFCTLAHLAHLRERYDIRCIAGNSLGWYTALAAASALSVRDGWRLVTGMAALQKEIAGGQVLATTVDQDWRRDPELCRAIDEVLTERRGLSADDFVARSIRLGGHEVLAGSEAGVRRLLDQLPKVQVGEREFPFQLAGHGPFHTALCAPTADRAAAELADLEFRPPAAHLIDGLGNLHTPWSADPAALRDYTFATQITETYDFTASVRTATREFCPDRLLCAGPGESLRAPVGHVLLAEGFRGVHTKTKLFESALVALE